MYRFAEQIDKPGFVFMDSPGYDPCSVTGQIAAGATLVAFTTGRGSVSGFMPTPSLKLATNTDMYERMRDDMDVNCGDVISQGVSLEERAGRSSISFSGLRPERRPEARHWVSAERSLCLGKWAPSCKAARSPGLPT